jgi:hypothetical protein
MQASSQRGPEGELESGSGRARGLLGESDLAERRSAQKVMLQEQNLLLEPMFHTQTKSCRS